MTYRWTVHIYYFIGTSFPLTKETCIKTLHSFLYDDCTCTFVSQKRNIDLGIPIDPADCSCLCNKAYKHLSHYVWYSHFHCSVGPEAVNKGSWDSFELAGDHLWFFPFVHIIIVIINRQ